MTLTAVQSTIARALAKLAQEVPPVVAPIPPAAPVPPVPSVPALPDTKAVVQKELVKTPIAAPPAPVSAIVPDARSGYLDYLMGRRQFDPKADIASPQFQQLYKSRLPTQQDLTPEQFAPIAEKEAFDFQRTASPARLAGHYLRQHRAGVLDAAQLQEKLTELRAGHDALTPEEQQEWVENQARGFYGDKQYDVLSRYAGEGRELPTDAAKFNIKDMSTWWGAAKDIPGLAATAIGGHDPREDARILSELTAGSGGGAAAPAAGTPSTEPDQIARLNAALKAKQTPGQFLHQEMVDEGLKQVTPLLAAAKNPENSPSMMAQLKDGAAAFFSEPRNWLIPLGGLLMLFGGKTAKILGGLALAGGAADLYGRYQGIKAMGETPEGQTAYKEAVTFKNEKGESQPFGNLKELMTKYPAQAQALSDTNTLFAMGLRNQFDKRVVAQAVKQMTAMGIPADAALTRMTEQKLIDQARADELRQDFAQQAQEAAQRQAQRQAEAQQAVGGGA